MTALAFSACEQVENVAPETGSTSGKQITLTAEFEPDTKVDYSDGAKQLKWKENGEQITVFFMDATKKVIGTETFNQCGVSAEGKVANFTGELMDGTAYFLAVYPATNAKISEDLSTEENGGVYEFTYDFSTQDGQYGESKTVLRTPAIIPIVDGQSSSPITFQHWTYIIDATLDFGTVTGTATDIVFESTNCVRSKRYWVKSAQYQNDDKSPWNADTHKGNIVISQDYDIVDGKVNVKLYAFGNNLINGDFTCKVGGKDYTGTLASRAENCENGKQYTTEIQMRAVSALTEVSFDFSDPEIIKFLGGWPMAATNDTSKEGGVKCKYTMTGIDYYFILADCLGAKSGGIYYSETKKCIWMSAQYRFIGLPIGDEKLVKVVVNTIATGEDNTGNIQIVEGPIDTTANKPKGEYKVVPGGELTPCAKGKEADTVITFNLTETVADTQYYIMDYGNRVCIDSITLTYSK